jgi:3'(2'), 5'-bisphosphate nucleotidase
MSSGSDSAGAGGKVPPTGDGAFARWLAGRAGDLLLEIRHTMGHRDPAALMAAGDSAAHNLLRTDLARWRPQRRGSVEEDDDARQAWSVESRATAPGRLSAERVWIVDPLDGTREYAEVDRSDWAVHVALWSRHAATPHRLVVGALALPAQHRLLCTDDRPPSPRDRMANAASTAGAGSIRLAVSRTRPPPFLATLALDIGAALVPIGSVGAKVAAVISGEVDGYLHAGGQYEWDSAAPVVVAISAGLHASRIDGSSLRYNQANPWLPDLLVCRPDIATQLLIVLRRHGIPEADKRVADH